MNKFVTLTKAVFLAALMAMPMSSLFAARVDVAVNVNVREFSGFTEGSLTLKLCIRENNIHKVDGPTVNISQNGDVILTASTDNPNIGQTRYSGFVEVSLRNQGAGAFNTPAVQIMSGSVTSFDDNGNQIASQGLTPANGLTIIPADIFGINRGRVAGVRWLWTYDCLPIEVRR